jgi:hypothetical protein
MKTNNIMALGRLKNTTVNIDSMSWCIHDDSHSDKCD